TGTNGRLAQALATRIKLTLIAARTALFETVFISELSLSVTRSPLDDLFGAHGDRLAPPALRLRDLDVGPAHLGLPPRAVTQGERHVFPRCEVGRVRLPVRPLLRGRARSREAHHACHHQRSRESVNHRDSFRPNCNRSFREKRDT